MGSLEWRKVIRDGKIYTDPIQLPGVQTLRGVDLELAGGEVLADRLRHR